VAPPGERIVKVAADEASGAREEDIVRHLFLQLATVATWMSPRLDLPIAVVSWLLGFAWVQVAGSWTPLALLAVLAAARLILGDPETRQLLRPRAGDLALGGAGAAVMIAGTYGLYRVLASAFPALPGATRSLYVVLNTGGFSAGALAALVALLSTCEEVAWRGRSLTSAVPGDSRRRSLHPLLRVGTVAVLYGGASLASGSLLLGALATACGLWWGLLRVAGRSLWPAIITHAAWDLAILVGWPLA